MRITKYAADGTPIASGLIAVTFSATPTGIFDSNVSTSGGIASVTLSMDNQSGNTILASPSDGSSGSPTFRALVSADIPNLAASKITSEQLALARGGTNADLSATGGTAQFLKQSSSGAAVTVGTIANSDLPTVDVSHGGTGQTTLTAHNALIGNGTSAVSSLAPGTTRNAMLSDGTDWASRAIIAADLGSVLTTKGDLLSYSSLPLRVAVGTDGHSVVADSTATPGIAYKQRLARAYHQDSGFILRKLDNATLYVTPGMVEVNGALVEVTTLTKLGMATNADWIGGTSNEAASSFAYVYIDGSGNIKLHNKAPNCPTPAAAVATMLVNQSTWDGTNTKGLNATATIYDGDTGEGSVTEGMLALIYASTDSDYSLGRGRGSAAAGSNNDVSAALVTAISTGGAGGTITFEAGHNIAIRDNDRIAVVPFGPMIYRSESGTWYRLLGAMFNNASSNLEDNRHHYGGYYNANESSNYTISSATMTDMDSTNLTVRIFSTGKPVVMGLSGTSTTSSGAPRFDVTMDAVLLGGDTGFLVTGAITQAMAFTHVVFNVLPGTHVFTLQWSCSAGTATFYAGAGTANLDVHPQFYAYETGDH